MRSFHSVFSCISMCVIALDYINKSYVTIIFVEKSRNVNEVLPTNI